MNYSAVVISTMDQYFAKETLAFDIELSQFVIHYFESVHFWLWKETIIHISDTEK